MFISGERVSLEALNEKFVNDKYISWLNDKEVNAFLEIRYVKNTENDVRNFVRSITNSKDNFIFAIIENSTGMHIGNIKIGPINLVHNTADISYFIGEKSVWGKGLGSEAIKIITEFGFKSLKLYKIQAGVYPFNKSSIKALEKNGFFLEAIFRDQLIYNGKRCDLMRYGKFGFSIKNENRDDEI